MCQPTKPPAPAAASDASAAAASSGVNTAAVSSGLVLQMYHLMWVHQQ